MTEHSLLNYKETVGILPQRVLIYGLPKTGKTLAIGQLAAKWKLLWLDLESGASVLMNNLPDSYLENITYIKIQDDSFEPNAATTLLYMWEQGRKGAGYICKDHCKWKCAMCSKKKDEFFSIDLRELTPENGWIIVVDSGTQYGLSAFNHVCNDNNISLEDGEKASFTIYSAQGAYINKLFSMIQSGANHAVISSHEQELEMADKSKKLASTVGTTKLSANFGKYFDTIVRATKLMGVHKLQSSTAEKGNIDVGSRCNIDLSKAGTSMLDLFEPANAVVPAPTATKLLPQTGAVPTTKFPLVSKKLP